MPSFSKKPIFKKLAKKFTAERIILILAVVFGVFGLWRVLDLHLMKSLTDQNAHLNFSRFVLDSMTPGLDQIGFWPPLLHLLMIPAVAIPWLYKSGLAGFVVLLPFLALGAFFLYRVCLLVTERKTVSFVAAILFLANPYVLYYTATPMMEVLFSANLIAVSYFMARWLETDKLKHLLLVGIFVTLSVVSRFEGLVLIPITIIIVLVQLVRKKKNYYQIEAAMILFLILTVMGGVSILAYSWAFGGSPFVFSDLKWWIRDPLEAVFPGKGDILASVNYFLHSAFYMLGKPLLFLSLISLVFLSITAKKKFQTFSVLFILSSPFFFVLYALYNGSVTIYVPELPPFDMFHNDRYSLSLVGFTVVSIVLFLGSIYPMRKEKRKPSYFFKFALVNTIIIGVVSLSFWRLYSVSMVDNYKVISSNVNSPAKEQEEVANYLANNYDYGKILTTRSDNDPIISRAGILLKNYIYEGNYSFYDQSMKEPWYFARWVVMHNPENADDRWAFAEPVFQKWENSETFHRYYDLVLENSKRKLYKVNEDMVREIAYERNYDVTKIPSVNPEISSWNPGVVYANIQSPPLAQYVRPLPTKPELKTKMMDFYAQALKKEYERGFYVDSAGKGNSESQSYALLQSYWADDRETFDKVWAWTNKYIRRSGDRLFSWKFEFDNDKNEVRILDANSATDADADIAYALLRAGEDWNRQDYLNEGTSIIKDLWRLEVVTMNGKNYLLAGNWANYDSKIIINPSYFSPFAYRLFVKYDPDHDWISLVENQYSVLVRVSGNEIRGKANIFLPPDWAVIDKNSYRIMPYADRPNSRDYSYDAFRIGWRVAMDNMLYPNEEAKKYLEQIKVFEDGWDKRRKVCSVYEFKDKDDSYSCYVNIGAMAGPLSVFIFTKPELAERIMNKYYFSDGNGNMLAAETRSTNFYEKSWYWFAVFLWTNS